MPECTLYGPLQGFDAEEKIIVMTVEEYETIRLIDLEGMTQEDCADKMQVARGTVQSIYKTARGKIADSLVNGFLLKIEGGDFQLYAENDQYRDCERCRRRRCVIKNIEGVKE